MDKQELPVFFDATGRRWYLTKWFLAALLVAVVGLFLKFVPLIAAPAPLPGGVVRGAMAPIHEAHDLEQAFNASNTPVIGRGQFIRAVSVRGTGDGMGLYDVFSGRHIRDVTPEEQLDIGTNRYALERYGQVPDGQMVLTFDDGPHPDYTPRLLDTLSRQHVPAAFFVVGSAVVKYPDVAERITREGHTIANHTFSHLDFDYGGSMQGMQEINQTTRVITAATGHRTAFMRVPYAGATDQSLRAGVKGILHAQRLGYVPVAYDYDTRDWAFKSAQKPDPSFLDGSGKILLLHDAGGDRSHTLQYVKELIPMARKAGYQFVGLESVYHGRDLQVPARPTAGDKAAFTLGQMALVWPVRLIGQLFALNVLLILLVIGTNVTFAVLQNRRARRPPKTPRSYRPLVSVLIPAYNEAKVLTNSVRSVLASHYKHIEVIIIDDGSKDDTYAVARKLAAKYPCVTAVRQRNSGKAVALNRGLRRAKGEVVVCMDADTVFERETMWRLARHFYDPNVAGVAGYVRVGNIQNALTRWQALEYMTSIAIERGAQAFLGAITVVPGACGAWRRKTVLAAGGFSHRTLAEDCDIALSVRETGYAIVQEPNAISYTECPLNLEDLAKQRFRWVFGNIQSYWKHRRMFFNRRFGWLGMFVLPNAALSVLLPMLFWPFLVTLTAANVLAGRWWVMLIFFGVMLTLQFIVAGVGLALARESPRHLVAVPMTRLVYAPLRTYILYRSLLTALSGAFVGWNKVSRSQTVTAPARSRPFRANQ